MREKLTELLEELGRAYEQSDIKKFCIKNKYQWHYSLATTKMIKDKPLIIGFNWGAAKGVSYEPQSTIEDTGFGDEETGTLVRIKPFCRQYYDDEFLESASQTNYCLFRSRNEGEITSHDIELCEPIFERIISTLRPSEMLSFSSKLRDYLVSGNKISDLQKKTIEFQRGARKVRYTAVKGRLGGIPILCLPHPNYPMRSNARQVAWEFCCRGN